MIGSGYRRAQNGYDPGSPTRRPGRKGYSGGPHLIPPRRKGKLGPHASVAHGREQNAAPRRAPR
jgi:hypothetical protein